MEKYDHQKIEKKWQEIWAKEGYGKAQDFSSKPKHYHLVEFPYPSGEGLHLGHCMSYGPSDAYCRMKRMQGYEVMFPMGWDAFGLPTENYALQNKIKPQVATKKNVANFRQQMKSLGYSFDWSREVNTTDPSYYRWTQWIFLQFYKHVIVNGKLIQVADENKATPRLAYQAEMPVNWCPSCKINLANEEVIAGNCERCGTATIKKMQKQWLLRITAYAARLISDLDKVDYQPRIKTQQINWIGRSEGTNIKFKIDDSASIEVFTTRADTLFGCTYVVLAPEHPLVDKIKAQISNIKEVEDYIDTATRKSDLERAEIAKEKTGVELKGVKAINPINNEKVAVWIADYCLLTYGTGAVMAVPAHDERDWDFAKKYKIEIRKVISSSDESDDKSNVEYGTLVHSGEFDGLSSKEAQKKITEKLKQIGAGDFATNYKLRDWIFSRQHYWGEPIPIVHCQKCGIVPLDEKDLPLELPEVEHYEPTDTGESPLAKISDWVNTKCPRCGGDAKRETDTMPNWAGSSWYFLRYCDPKNDKVLADRKKLDFWLPVDLYNGGMEHITLHLLYSRFWHKFLFDLGLVPMSEPYKKRITHGIILGPDHQKMSKSRGNIINPDTMVEKFGADALRMYIMFIGPYDQELAWSLDGLAGISRFLNRVNIVFSNKTENTQDIKKENQILINKTIKKITEDLENFHFNIAIASLMECLNNYNRPKNLWPDENKNIFLILLAPFAPYLTEELWQRLGNKNSIFQEKWPEFDKNLIIDIKINIPIQINGKTKAVVEVDPNWGEAEITKFAQSNSKINKILSQAEIKKVIYVPRRIINFVVE